MSDLSHLPSFHLLSITIAFRSGRKECSQIANYSAAKMRIRRRSLFHEYSLIRQLISKTRWTKRYV